MDPGKQESRLFEVVGQLCRIGVVLENDFITNLDAMAIGEGFREREAVGAVSKVLNLSAERFLTHWIIFECRVR